MQTNSAMIRGCVSAVDSLGRTIFTVDAHRNENQRFIVRADEKLTAFLALKSIIVRGSLKLIRRSKTVSPCARATCRT